jgi:hypothetical protein
MSECSPREWDGRPSFWERPSRAALTARKNLNMTIVEITGGITSGLHPMPFADRNLQTKLGEVRLKIPKLRRIERYRRGVCALGISRASNPLARQSGMRRIPRLAR